MSLFQSSLRTSSRYHRLHPRHFRVKLPKTFLAVNLSDAFTFQEKERQNSEGDVFDRDHQDDERDSGLEMRGTEPSKLSLSHDAADDGLVATDSARDDKLGSIT